MRPLFAVELMECSVDVLRSVTFLVSQDQTHQFRRHVIVSWHYYIYVFNYIFLLLSKHFVWR